MENPYSSMPPIPISIAKGTGNGLVDGQIIKTNDGIPNIVVKVFNPVRSLVIEFLANYSKAFVGLIGAAVTPLGSKLLYAGDFWHMVTSCASLALAGPAITLITNISVILNVLKDKYPLVFGSKV